MKLGFSLIELLITLALFSILIAAGASLTQNIQKGVNTTTLSAEAESLTEAIRMTLKNPETCMANLPQQPNFLDVNNLHSIQGYRLDQQRRYQIAVVGENKNGLTPESILLTIDSNHGAQTNSHLRYFVGELRINLAKSDRLRGRQPSSYGALLISKNIPLLFSIKYVDDKPIIQSCSSGSQNDLNEGSIQGLKFPTYRYTPWIIQRTNISIPEDSAAINAELLCPFPFISVRGIVNSFWTDGGGTVLTTWTDCNTPSNPDTHFTLDGSSYPRFSSYAYLGRSAVQSAGGCQGNVEWCGSGGHQYRGIRCDNNEHPIGIQVSYTSTHITRMGMICENNTTKAIRRLHKFGFTNNDKSHAEVMCDSTQDEFFTGMVVNRYAFANFAGAVSNIKLVCGKFN